VDARSPQPSHADDIVDLGDLSRRDVGRAGVKAATLGELANAGFPVPEGFVLTAAAFERFLADNAFHPDSPPDVVASGRLPPDLTRALARAAVDLGDVCLAVRSSGTAEDLPDAALTESPGRDPAPGHLDSLSHRESGPVSDPARNPSSERPCPGVAAWQSACSIRRRRRTPWTNS